MLYIKVEPQEGEVFEDSFREAKRLACMLNCGIEFNFSGVTNLVNRNSDLDISLEMYLDSLKARK